MPDPFLRDPDFTLWQGDALDVLAGLPDGSVDCVVTSPPYWRLRDYGTGEWEGGDPACDHARPTTNYNHGFNERWGQGAGARKQERKSAGQYAGECPRCGAVRVDRQLGLEATPAEYAARLVAILGEARRLLAPHGTLWLNLGDCYADGQVDGLKAKDLVGVPWEVAFALRADGWWLRSEIVWAKANPMPESITDRPTVAHEQVFLLARSGEATYWTHRIDGRARATRPDPDFWWFPPAPSEVAPSRDEVDGWARRNAWLGHDYYYDREAVREPLADATLDDPRFDRQGRQETPYANGAGGKAEGLGRGSRVARAPDGTPVGRNMRTVWQMATQPYHGAHFATFPVRLPARCIEAGCPELVCLECGVPRERVYERSFVLDHSYNHRSRAARSDDGDDGEHGQWRSGPGEIGSYAHRHVGYTDCGHASFRPGVVLDPFMGAGTTALAARQLGRHTVGVELSAGYCERIIAPRLAQLGLLTGVT